MLPKSSQLLSKSNTLLALVFIIGLPCINGEHNDDHESASSSLTPTTFSELVDACEMDQALEITNNEITLQAYTGSKTCSMPISLNNGASDNLSVQMHKSNLQTAYTYSYIEVLESEGYICSGQLVLLPNDRVPCTVFIRGSRFVMHFQNTKMKLELRANDVKKSMCFEGFLGDNNATTCEVSSYENVVKQNNQNNKYIIGAFLDRWSYKPKYVNFRVNMQMIQCECECPTPCICKLFYAKWQYTCNTDFSTHIVRSDLIVYEEDTEGISFANTGLSVIHQNAFGELNMLKCLLFDHNNIQTLPSALFQNLIQLQVLDIAFNSLTYLNSDMFHSLVQLVTITINNNNFSTLPNGVFASLESIPYSINLSHNKMSELPEEAFASLYEIGGYGTIDLSYNKLMSLANGTFASLNKIGVHATLDISHNKLILINNGIFASLNEIGEYAFLDLSHNKLTSLAGTFASLNEIGRRATLDLSHNELVSISEETFASLNDIGPWVTLDLSHNDLMGLGTTIDIHHNEPEGSFTSLFGKSGTLDLSHNDLMSLPKGTFANHGLGSDATLDLSHNELMSLPKGTFAYFLREIKQSATLDLSHNNLMSLANGTFAYLNRIDRHATLDLSNNELVSLPAGAFAPLNSIRDYATLDLSHNKLVSLPEGVFLNEIDEPRWVSLSSYYYGYIDRSPLLTINQFVTLDLSHNKLISLPEGTFTPLTEIASHATLDLSHNELVSLPEGTFASVNEIGEGATLDLNHNKLTSLPDRTFASLGKIGTLASLNLSTNQLTSLPYAVFPSLRHVNGILDLSYNNLVTLTRDMIPNLQEIQGTIFLSHNEFSALPDEIIPSTETSSSTNSQILNLKHSNLTMIPDYVLGIMHSLIVLDLSHNSLRTLSEESFGKTHNMLSLNLRNNKLNITSSLTFRSFFALQILDLSQNNIEELPLNIFKMTENLLNLDMSENSLDHLPHNVFEKQTQLIRLSVHSNFLSTLPSFRTQVNLHMLDLSNNTLQNLTSESFIGLVDLTLLFISRNQLTNLPKEIFYLSKVTFINASYNSIQKVGKMAFNSQLETLDLRKNSLYKITHKTFQLLNKSSVVLVDKFSACCFIDYATCVSQEPRPEYLTCNRMLPNLFIMIPMWAVAIFALSCNGIAAYLRLRKKQANKVQTLLISQLSFSDFLMGIAMLILVIADLYYHDFFPSYAQGWRLGLTCKIAGFLSILSSEGSVFFITLISIDRLLVIKHPFADGRLTTMTARTCVAHAWIAAILISFIAIGLSNEDYSLVTISEVCIGIPIVRRHKTIERHDQVQINKIDIESKLGQNLTYTQGQWTGVNYTFHPKEYQENIPYTVTDVTGSQISPLYSILIFVGVNLLCFIIVAACYIEIFRIARNTSQEAERRQNNKQEMRMVKRMFPLVFTDFCCWLPLCLMCVLIQFNVIDIPPVMYVWIVGFVIPINSSINPLMYVIYGEISDYRQKIKNARKAQEKKVTQQHHN